MMTKRYYWETKIADSDISQLLCELSTATWTRNRKSLFTNTAAKNMKLVSENIKYRSWKLIDLKDYERSLFNKQDGPKASLSNKSMSRSNLSTMHEWIPKTQTVSTYAWSGQSQHGQSRPTRYITTFLRRIQRLQIFKIPMDVIRTLTSGRM